MRVLRRALACTLPEAAPARLDRLERLAAALHAAVRRQLPLRATLGGACVILQRDTMLTLVPEGVRRRGHASQEANGVKSER